MKIKITRNDLIEVLKSTIVEIAKKYGYEFCVNSEDRQKGVWGEELTKMLEKEYGECTHEFQLYKNEKKGDNFGFRYRFEDPCIYFRFHKDDENVPGRKIECLAELEYHTHAYVPTGEKYQEDKGYHKKGEDITEKVEIEPELSQVMIWHPEYAMSIYREMEEMVERKMDSLKNRKECEFFSHLNEVAYKVGDMLYKKFAEDADTLAKVRRPVLAENYLCAVISYGVVKKNIPTGDINEIIKNYLKEIGEEEIIDDMFSLIFHESCIARAIAARKDLAQTLRDCKDGRKAGSELGSFLMKDEIGQLALLHKSNKFRKKIEELLEYCNFKQVSSDFADGKYDEFVRMEA